MSYNLVWEQTVTGAADGMHGEGGGVIRAGELFLTGHICIGVTPTKFTFNLKKSDSPTGTAELKLINSSNVEKASFGTIDVTSLTTSFVSHDFINDANTEIIENGDRVAFYYTGDKYFTLELSNYETSEDYTNESYYVTGWTNRTNMATMKVYDGAIPSTGTRLPPPPIMVRF